MCLAGEINTAYHPQPHPGSLLILQRELFPFCLIDRPLFASLQLNWNCQRGRGAEHFGKQFWGENKGEKKKQFWNEVKLAAARSTLTALLIHRPTLCLLSLYATGETGLANCLFSMIMVIKHVSHRNYNQVKPADLDLGIMLTVSYCSPLSWIRPLYIMVGIDWRQMV